MLCACIKLLKVRSNQCYVQDRDHVLRLSPFVASLFLVEAAANSWSANKEKERCKPDCCCLHPFMWGDNCNEKPSAVSLSIRAKLNRKNAKRLCISRTKEKRYVEVLGIKLKWVRGWNILLNLLYAEKNIEMSRIYFKCHQPIWLLL